jgi:hypothetical protein
MHRCAEGNLLDAHVVRADVVALRLTRAAAAARPAHASGGASTVRSITASQDRRRPRPQAPPYFPGDAA